MPVGQLVAERQHGVVKWFSSKMGYGFIGRKKGTEDIFVHYSSILSEGFKSLFEGNRVAFDVERTNKGLEAKNVRVVN